MLVDKVAILINRFNFKYEGSWLYEFSLIDMPRGKYFITLLVGNSKLLPCLDDIQRPCRKIMSHFIIGDNNLNDNLLFRTYLFRNDQFYWYSRA